MRTISRDQEPLATKIPQGECEHAAEPLHTVVALVFVEVNYHLGIGMRREAMAGVQQSASKLAIVVNLSIQDDHDRAVLVEDGLIARLQIDDRQALDT